MNTKQIQCVINCDEVMKNIVVGVYARDQIPQNIPNTPYGYIVNTDASDKRGAHWLAVLIDSNNKGEFFDSYGHSPQFYNFPFELSYNSKRLQSSYSLVCGHYCLYYLLNRCRNISMKTIVNIFGSEYNDNDSYVSKYIENAFPFCFSFHCKIHSQSCLELCK